MNDISIGVEVTKYFSDFKKNGSEKQKNFSNWIKEAKCFREILKQKDQKYLNC